MRNKMPANWQRIRQEIVLPALLVLATVALAAIAGEIMRPWIQQTVMVFFIAAVVFNSWLNGLKAGVCTAVLSIVAAHFTTFPNESLFDPPILIQLALFLFIALIIGGLFERMHDRQELLQVTLSSIGDGVIVT